MKTGRLAAMFALLGGVAMAGTPGALRLGAEEAPVSSETEGPAQTKVPWGVRLRWGSPLGDAPLGIDHRMIVWGAPGPEVEALLGEDHYADWKGEDLWVLGTQERGGWWADLGGGYPRDYQTTLFFIDGRFYRYVVEIPPSRFTLVEAALIEAVGVPNARESSTVSNAMGAEFDQEIRAWEFEEVEINLMKRASRVTAGLLAVTYKPLAADVPKESAKAPF